MSEKKNEMDDWLADAPMPPDEPMDYRQAFNPSQQNLIPGQPPQEQFQIPPVPYIRGPNSAFAEGSIPESELPPITQTPGQPFFQAPGSAFAPVAPAGPQIPALPQAPGAPFLQATGPASSQIPLMSSAPLFQPLGSTSSTLIPGLPNTQIPGQPFLQAPGSAFAQVPMAGPPSSQIPGLPSTQPSTVPFLQATGSAFSQVSSTPGPLNSQLPSLSNSAPFLQAHFAQVPPTAGPSSSQIPGLPSTQTALAPFLQATASALPVPPPINSQGFPNLLSSFPPGPDFFQTQIPAPSSSQAIVPAQLPSANTSFFQTPVLTPSSTPGTPYSQVPTFFQPAIPGPPKPLPAPNMEVAFKAPTRKQKSSRGQAPKQMQSQPSYQGTPAYSQPGYSQKPGQHFSQPGPSYSQPGSSRSQKPGPSYSQPGPSYSSQKPGQNFSEPGPSYSQPGQSHSQKRGHKSSQPAGPSYSQKPGQNFSEPGPSYSQKPGQNFSEPGPSYSQKPGQNFSEPGPSYSQPGQFFDVYDGPVPVFKSRPYYGLDHLTQDDAPNFDVSRRLDHEEDSNDDDRETNPAQKSLPYVFEPPEDESDIIEVHPMPGCEPDDFSWRVSPPPRSSYMDEVWVIAYYFEENVRIGGMFCSTRPEFVIDGLVAPWTDRQMSIAFPPIHTSYSKCSVVRFVFGPGILVQRENKKVKMTLRTESSIFLQCPQLALMNGEVWNTVYRFKNEPGKKQTEIIIFDEEYFDNMLEKRKKFLNDDFYELHTHCICRFSIAKGFAGDYPRKTITDTPCWIEIYHAEKLREFDRIWFSDKQIVVDNVDDI
ncbi:unnamed protein product [Caenorhabditis angaria]|uniref:MH2 domain-containing protein n=1 Tax=Caenorhabditis angaria TaxID=860376 RepID=A0A9P1J1V2_9PELO|nr:unnamed protein product [Caenorhabditis angaria]